MVKQQHNNKLISLCRNMITFISCQAVADWCADTTLFIWRHSYESTIRCICKHPIISPRLWDFFSQYCVGCLIYIHWTTEHSLGRAYSVYYYSLTQGMMCKLMQKCPHILYIQSNLTSVHAGQTMQYIFFFSYLQPMGNRETADWVIVTHHILNSNSQEAPEWNESTNRAILHADEYAFVPAYAFFPSLLPRVHAILSSSIIHYVHNVDYWLLPVGRFNF